MTPDRLHYWSRASDPHAGQWVAGDAPQAGVALALDGPTLTEVRDRLETAVGLLARHLGRDLTTDAAKALREVLMARKALEMKE